MPDHTLFYLVFSIQIVLLSIYYPARLIARMRHVFTHYPVTEYPKLYPKSPQQLGRSINWFIGINATLTSLGLVILYFIYTGDLVDEEGINPLLPWGYFMLQMVPTQLMEFYGLKLSKLMKQQDSRTTKSANLAPRRFFDYVPRWLFTAVIACYIGFVVFAFYAHDFEFDIAGNAFLMSLILLLGYAFFFGMISWQIYRKKLDPYQRRKDHSRTIKLAVKTMCFTMMASVLFMAFAIAVDVYELDAIMPVAMSVFLQILVVISTGYMMQNSRLEDIDFDVYKADQPQT